MRGTVEEVGCRVIGRVAIMTCEVIGPNTPEMFNAIAIVLQGRFALVEAENHLSRDREQGQGSGMPQYEAILIGGKVPMEEQLL